MRAMLTRLQIDLIADTWWTFVVPCICLFAIITNILNICVFKRLKYVNTIYKVLYTKSIINLVYLFICFWVFLVKCGQYCDAITGFSHFVYGEFFIKVYKYYFYVILGRILGHFDLLLQIGVSLKRLRLLIKTRNVISNQVPTTNQGRKCYISHKQFISLVVLISVSFYVPVFFLVKIIPIEQNATMKSIMEIRNDNKTVISAYRVVVTNQRLYKLLDVITGFYFRASLMFFMLVFISVINVYQFKSKLLCNNANIRRTNLDAVVYQGPNRIRQISANFNTMLFCQSILYLVGNSSTLVVILFFFFSYDSHITALFPILFLVPNTLLFLSLGLNAFVYLAFDDTFRQESISVLSAKRSPSYY